MPVKCAWSHRVQKMQMNTKLLWPNRAAQPSGCLLFRKLLVCIKGHFAFFFFFPLYAAKPRRHFWPEKRTWKQMWPPLLMVWAVILDSQCWVMYNSWGMGAGFLSKDGLFFTLNNHCIIPRKLKFKSLWNAPACMISCNDSFRKQSSLQSVMFNLLGTRKY